MKGIRKSRRTDYKNQLEDDLSKKGITKLALYFGYTPEEAATDPSIRSLRGTQNKYHGKKRKNKIYQSKRSRRQNRG